MKRSEEPSPELPEKVDAALEALWRGKSAEFDRLLDTENGAGPGVGEMLRGVAPTDGASGLSTPSHIANYQIIGELGRGGMGVVYEAQQEHPQRRVALKVVRGGHFVDDHRIKLFQREIQTLARLKHANIAAIYEAGRTEDGQHFFAMELIRGVTLTQHARGVNVRPPRKPLSLDERLCVFVRLCEAINYAHQRGVIHRDLKPSNILITEESSGGRSGSTSSGQSDVKILDFGLARITDNDVAATTITTDTAKIKGTLAYMSPEQAAGNPANIDIRSDVYSLGVILYELLTGEMPHDLKHRTMADAVRIIQEQAAPKPSALDRALSGDVETIILKAITKEPARRYQSAAALADDVQRFLNHQPIMARPPSAAYQLRKLIARHTIPFAAAMCVLVVSMAGFAVSTSLYFQTQSARLAETEQRAVAEQISGFLTDMLASVDPRESGGHDVSLLRELLDNASHRVSTEFADRPKVRGALEHTIGQTYLSLGLYDRAETHLLTALGAFRGQYGEEHPRTLVALNSLAILRQDQGNLDEAERLFTGALDSRRRILGTTHPDTLHAVHNLGNLYGDMGKLPDAERLLQEAVAQRTSVLGQEHPDTLVSMDNLSKVFARQGNYAGAEKLLREVLANQQRVLPENHLDLFISMNDLAVTLKSQGKLADAELLYRKVVEGFRRIHGHEHMDTLITTSNLAGLLRTRGAVEEAIAIYRDLIKTAETALPSGHYLTAMFRGGYGRSLQDAERFPDAEVQLLACYNELKAAVGDAHPYTRMTAEQLVKLYEAWGKPDQAAMYRDETNETP